MSKKVVRYCRRCGCDISGTTRGSRYCLPCRSEILGKRCEKETSEERIARKVEAQKARTAKFFEDLDNEGKQTEMPVYVGTDPITGARVEWRGRRMSGRAPVHYEVVSI